MTIALYRIFAGFGLFSIFGSLVHGFRWNPAAPIGNLFLDLLLYGAFAVPHLIMTRTWFKQRFWGTPAGCPPERRVYITTSVITWLVVFALHMPVPGFYVDIPAWLHFAGFVFFLMSFRLFFNGITTEMIDGLLGVPSSAGSYSHGPETPLFTTGPYAQVRHPMYRAFVLAAISSLLIHPNAAQLVWCILVAGTFVGFIPVEEALLMSVRGEDYARYRQAVPWRLFRGLW